MMAHRLLIDISAMHEAYIGGVWGTSGGSNDASIWERDYMKEMKTMRDAGDCVRYRALGDTHLTMSRYKNLTMQ